MAPARALFVCVENANRSQMAEAFARLHGQGLVDAQSAGSRPSGIVNPKAVAAMRARGYDLTTHRSKTLDEVTGPFDYVITMGCGDVCPYVPARRTEDWALPDPRDLGEVGYAHICAAIEQRVLGLLSEIRAERGYAPSAP